MAEHLMSALDEGVRGGERAVKRGDMRRVECWRRVMDKVEHVH